MSQAERIYTLETENERLTIALRRTEQLLEELKDLGDLESRVSDLETLNARMRRALAEHEELREQAATASKDVEVAE